MDKKIAIARCHEIYLAIQNKEVPRFESITELGMATQLAIHIRGLPPVDYQQLKLVAATMLGIPRLAVDRIIRLLGEIEFVRIDQNGSKIRSIIPTVPYFDKLYDGLGEYFEPVSKPDEFEALTLEIVNRLADTPYNADTLANQLGAIRKDFNSTIELGARGGFLIERRARGKDILLNPSYFSENADIFIDQAAASGASSIQRTLELIRKSQGWPLSLIQKRMNINGTQVTSDDITLLTRLAQDGIVKPPQITTAHAGNQFFIFTPTPGKEKLNPLRRDVYERALAIVSAVRQGQLLPHKFRIRNPGAVLNKLRTELQLSPTSDYAEQYANLVSYRIAHLVPLDNGYRQLRIIDTPENKESLNIACTLIEGGTLSSLAVDPDAQSALTGDAEYVDSLISANQLRERETITLSDEKRFEYEQLLLDGI